MGGEGGGRAWCIYIYVCVYILIIIITIIIIGAICDVLCSMGIGKACW